MHILIDHKLASVNESIAAEKFYSTALMNINNDNEPGMGPAAITSMLNITCRYNSPVTCLRLLGPRQGRPAALQVRLPSHLSEKFQ